MDSSAQPYLTTPYPYFGLRRYPQCYDKRGREAAYAMDDDIRPWLKSFVESVGYETAKHLLTGAGDFTYQIDLEGDGSSVEGTLGQDHS